MFHSRFKAAERVFCLSSLIQPHFSLFCLLLFKYTPHTKTNFSELSLNSSFALETLDGILDAKHPCSIYNPTTRSQSQLYITSCQQTNDWK